MALNCIQTSHRLGHSISEYRVIELSKWVIFMFDIDKFKRVKAETTRYDRRIKALMAEGKDIQCIEATIAEALTNINSGVNSFVIYGDPQSGKTEMMIALTAKLLDLGHKVIVVILKDDVELLRQNLTRFARSGIDPTPKTFSEIIDPDVEIENKEWIIFCKKNVNDLKKLIDKIGHIPGKIIIDDEADYATPNAKINKKEKTKINDLVGKLLGRNWIYIGVTATPARLDLNNTFENANDKWIYFETHGLYTGQDIFFPIDLNFPLKYKINPLPEKYGDPSYLRNALFSFLVNVAYLNKEINKVETNYSMLIHTSGKKVDMSEDYKQVTNVFNSLSNKEDKNYEKYVRQIWDIAKRSYNTANITDELTSYILSNISRYKIVVMNSDTDRSNIDFTAATNPVALFTIAIGGNIVSRGVTFINLLSMFFTRDVKHKIQQDTYIQRARMFGEREKYLQYFELTIPEQLYVDWHRCFIFHRLSLESAKTGIVPVWLEDKRVRAVAPTSIDRTTVSMDCGEMSFDIFKYTSEIEQIVGQEKVKPIDKLRKMQDVLGNKSVPDFLIRFIERFSPDGSNSLAVHHSTDVSKWSDVDQENISRPRGFIGKSEQEENKYPHAIHHIKIVYNSSKKARVFYRYAGNIKFLKNVRGQ
jgi:hypothetical protein